MLRSMVTCLGSTETCWDLSGDKLQVIRVEDRPAPGSGRPRRESPFSLKVRTGTDITSLLLYATGQCSHRPAHMQGDRYSSWVECQRTPGHLYSPTGVTIKFSTQLFPFHSPITCS